MKNTPPIEELVEQFLEHCRNGNVPDVESFAAQYSEHQAQLLELLPVLLSMEALGKTKAVSETRRTATFPEMLGTEFRLLQEIGRGGMGVVFEALQLSLNRKVAVKLLSTPFTADERQRERFEQEAHVIAMLHHPNIVKVFSAGNSGDHCFYAMELVDGQGLDKCAFTDLREVAAIGLQAARALAYAHGCKVMHRDIKPANLLLDAARVVRVSDFGLAFVVKGEGDTIEHVDTQSGTLRYMAPERLAHGVNSFLTDQYALGATLYELVAQSPLLPERTPESLIKRICQKPVPPLTCTEPDLAAIINKSVSFDPADRYASMDDFADDLQRFLNHEPVKAHPPSVVKRFSLWAKRKPAVAVLSFAALVCAGAFAVALAVGYWRTASALTLAEQNAAVADTALARIFQHVAEQPPSKASTHLLATLMPYYQGITSQRGLPQEKIAEANAVIGTCALRAGSYSLAETSFQHLAELRSGAFPLNQLSEAMRRQGKIHEANALSQHVVKTFADSENPDDRLEAVRALKALSQRPDSAELARAFQIVQSLLRADPANPEYRFLFATILSGNPHLFRSVRISGVEPNAFVLLSELAESYPDRPEYGMALVELMRRKLHYAGSLTAKDQNELDAALKHADRLLGRWSNVPEVITAAAQLREAYATVLRKGGNLTGARRETERLLGVLEIFFHNPEAPDTAKECLLNLQFQRLELAARDGRLDEARQLATDIKEELVHYNGALSAEYSRRLTHVLSQINNNPTGEP